MSIAFAEFETAVPLTELQAEGFVPRSKQTRAGFLQCLVVSENAERREFLAESARAAGWEVAVHDNAHAALIAANRNRFALSIVDLADPLAGQEPSTTGSFRQLTEQLSTASQTLMMVCGSEGNPLEEIWARQLGTWLYLAGIDLTCDVQSLCTEAKHVAQKLNSQPAYARTA